jgi:tRNA G18 (ribose-2'-O)-methylase SpoU
MKLKPDVLRFSEPTAEQLEYLKKHKQDIYIILDDVLDTYNIGAIFRLADALNVKAVYLCGMTETPPNHRIKKASVNTWQWIEWEYKATAVDAIQSLKLKVQNLNVVAVEQDARSIPYDKFNYKLPVALIVGHETNGVSKEALDLSDAIVELPMHGINTSLNVMVSLGIVLYEVIEKNSS